MKKSIVAVGVIVALGACWVGGAVYTSKQVEPGVADFVAGFNKSNKENSRSLRMTASYKDFSTGIFSSHFQMVVTFNSGSESVGIKPGQRAVFDVNVDHGPFPSLMKGNLSPAMASLSVTPVNNDLTKIFFDAANGHVPVDANIRVAYDTTYTTQLKVAPASYQDAATRFAFDGGKFTFQGSQDALSTLKTQGQLDNVVIDLKAKNTHFTSDALAVSGTSHMEGNKMPVGDGEVKLSNIRVNVAGKETAQIGAFSSKTVMALTDNHQYMNISLQYGIDDLKRGSQNLGSGKAALMFEAVDPKALTTFINNYNKAFNQAIVANPALMEDTRGQELIANALIRKYVPVLQKSEPVINIPVSWKNEKGEIKADIAFAIADPAKAAMTEGSTTASLDRNVKKMSANVVMPIDAVTHISKQVNLAAGADDVSAQQQAEKAIDNLLSVGRMLDVIRVGKDAATLQLEYSQGHVIFNGKEMTAEEFVARRGHLLP